MISDGLNIVVCVHCKFITVSEPQVDEKLKSKVLHFVNVWNRPDIAEEEVFNLENKEVIYKLEVFI